MPTAVNPIDINVQIQTLELDSIVLDFENTQVVAAYRLLDSNGDKVLEGVEVFDDAEATDYITKFQARIDAGQPVVNATRQAAYLKLVPIIEARYGI